LYKYLSEDGKVIKKDICTEDELKAAMVMGDPESRDKFCEKVSNIDPDDQEAVGKIKREWEDIVEQFFAVDELADEYEFGMIQRLNIDKQIIEEAIKVVDEHDFWSWLK
jgi:NAD(P)H-nitrite reductase large subunit